MITADKFLMSPWIHPSTTLGGNCFPFKSCTSLARHSRSVKKKMAAWLVKFINILCFFIIFKSSSGGGTSKAIKPVESIVQYQQEYKLPDLPYAYDGLEPHMDEATLRVHHLGHHAAYTKKLNLALRQWRESVKNFQVLEKKSIKR